MKTLVRGVDSIYTVSITHVGYEPHPHPRPVSTFVPRQRSEEGHGTGDGSGPKTQVGGP